MPVAEHQRREVSDSKIALTSAGTPGSFRGSSEKGRKGAKHERAVAAVEEEFRRMEVFFREKPAHEDGPEILSHQACRQPEEWQERVHDGRRCGQKALWK